LLRIGGDFNSFNISYFAPAFYRVFAQVTGETRWLSAAFIGPAGVGAMHSSAYQSFVDDVYGLVRQNNMWCGGQYYDESWTMLTMLMLTGNFLDYTRY
jgi:hypothetical protein